MKNNIEKLRIILLEELKKLEENKVVLLPFPSDFINYLLFENKEFVNLLIPVLHKIDYSNVCFDGINVSEFIFDGLKNVKINPQTVYNKDLCYGSFDGVEFIGTFNGVSIYEASFKGSKNAVIDPQSIYMKDASGTNFRDAIIIGSFDGVYLEGAKLEGATYFPVDIKVKDTHKKISFEEDFRDKIKTLVLDNNNN